MVHERVNGKTYAAVVRVETEPFMARTKSSLVMSDCVQLNNCRLVKEARGEFGVKVHPSAGHPDNIVGGVAPYSSDLSIEDATMFGVFQEEISQKMHDLAPSNTHTRVAQLRELILQVWCTEKYRMLAVKAIDSVAKACG